MSGLNVLELGFGTAVLTEKLYNAGAKIFGVDFSPEMTAKAYAKLPNAALFTRDFALGLPREWDGVTFAYVISTYAFHHVTYERQPGFIRELAEKSENGVIIGDIMFETRADYDFCRNDSGGFDDDECYIIVDELRDALSNCTVEFTRTSHCAGVLSVHNRR